MYLDKIGWVQIDASPEQSEELSPQQVSRAEQNYYGEKNKGNPLVQLNARQQHADRRKMIEYSIGALVALLILAITFAYSIKIWRQLAIRYSSDRHLSRICYRAVLDRLAEVGAIRRFGETREEFSQRNSSWAPEFREMTMAHLQSELHAESSCPRSEWLAWQIQISKRISTAFSFRQRIRGLLNPLT